MELKKSILYLSLHNSLKKIHGINRPVEKEKIKIKLGRQYLVPKRLRDEAIKELEKIGLIKIKGNIIYILNGEFDLENKPNEFFKCIGML